MKVKNPIVTELRRSSDPFVTYYNGVYYSCYTDKVGVYISETDSLMNLATAKEHCVFDECGEWYAPELHHIKNKWYIYGAPADLEGYTKHTMSVLVSKGDDPIGPYTFKGPVGGLENQWSIDGTLLNLEDKTYMIWSNGKLLISEMVDPLNLTGERKIIAEPVKEWETVMSPIAEGPFVIKKDGFLHIIYSASNSKCDDYCLGLLTCKNGNVMDPDSWIKSEQPVYTDRDIALLHSIKHQVECAMLWFTMPILFPAPVGTEGRYTYSLFHMKTVILYSASQNTKSNYNMQESMIKYRFIFNCILKLKLCLFQSKNANDIFLKTNLYP